MGGNGAKMAIHPLVVRAAREGWRWQWLRLMGGLGPADQGGHYRRPTSTPMQTLVLGEKELEERDSKTKPQLIVGRSCPWAHRVWLVFQLRGLSASINLLMADAEYEQALRYLVFMPHPEEGQVPLIDEALLAVHLNLAATKLRLCMEEKAIKHATDALATTPPPRGRSSQHKRPNPPVPRANSPRPQSVVPTRARRDPPYPTVDRGAWTAFHSNRR